jgi:predicted alpha/beta hydrolase family esterase
MKKVLILHGWNGSTFPHWQAQLAKDLQEASYEVSFPLLPNMDLPLLEEWLESLDKLMQEFVPDIVVCHSLSNVLWFHYVNRYEVKELEKLMLVAPVSPACVIEDIQSFFPYAVPTDLRAKTKIMATGDNDPYLTIDEAYTLSNMLKIGLKVMEGAGHINIDSGFGKLDCAYDWVIS